MDTVKCFRIIWDDNDLKQHEDYFVTPRIAHIMYPGVYGGLSWVHTWDKPEEGLRKFLTHLPLNTITITHFYS